MTAAKKNHKQLAYSGDEDAHEMQTRTPVIIARLKKPFPNLTKKLMKSTGTPTCREEADEYVKSAHNYMDRVRHKFPNSPLHPVIIEDEMNLDRRSEQQANVTDAEFSTDTKESDLKMDSDIERLIARNNASRDYSDGIYENEDEAFDSFI